jgi:hypothetical protein
VGTIGMGGIGKTQLAVEFAHRFSYSFHAVYWIQAASPETWLSEFTSITTARLRREIKDLDKLEGVKRASLPSRSISRTTPTPSLSWITLRSQNS